MNSELKARLRATLVTVLTIIPTYVLVEAARQSSFEGAAATWTTWGWASVVAAIPPVLSFLAWARERYGSVPPA